ncbi:MAG TPA: hypothetical protein VGP31_07175 [Planosporangium sp.]|nr:hypothetical protein [Planosporangium sp.]
MIIRPRCGFGEGTILGCHEAGSSSGNIDQESAGGPDCGDGIWYGGPDCGDDG